jgi:AbrB family looped-hinge helix DNA binding protein
MERAFMRITSKGQVTIPIDVREKTGLLPGTEVTFVVEDDGVRLVKAASGKDESRGEQAVRLLRGGATRKLGISTDELMKLLRGE